MKLSGRSPHLFGGGNQQTVVESTARTLLSEEEKLTIGEVAVLIGVSPHTIRSWEQRYGLLTPHRSVGNQRRYTLEDVEVLRRVKQIRGSRRGSLRIAVQQAVGRLEPPAPSEDLWRWAADLYLGPVAMIGARGYLVDCNRAFAELTGRSREELVGDLFVDLVDPRDRYTASQFYRRPLAVRDGWKLHLRTADGSSVPCLVDGVPAGGEETAVLICRVSPASPGPGESREP